MDEDMDFDAQLPPHQPQQQTYDNGRKMLYVPPPRSYSGAN